MRLRRGYKRIKRWITFQLLRLLISPISFLPESLAFPVGRALGAVAYVLAAGPRSRARRQLRERLGLDAPSAEETTRSMFRHFGWMIVELLLLSRDPTRLLRWVSLDAGGSELLARLTASGRGAIAISAHLGNWELLAPRIAAEGYGLLTAARENANRHFDRWVVALRERGGVRTLHRGDAAAFLEVRRILRTKSFFAALIDQDTRVPSVFVPFLGRPASTPRAPAELALRLDLPVFAGFIVRDGPGRHHVVLEEISTAELAGDSRDARVEALTARMSAVLERHLRSAPEQWVWFHERWKRVSATDHPGAVAALPPDRS